MISKVAGKRHGAGLSPKGANVHQTKHPSKHQGRQFGKTFGLHKAYDKNSARPTAGK